VTVSDTVGFVRKLPHDLVEAFKSTLEEVSRAGLVLHVADASAGDVQDQMHAVRSVLGEIGAGDLPEVLALNKWDLVDEGERDRILRRHPDGVPISALDGHGIDRLLERLGEALPQPPIEVDLVVPFDRPEVVPRLYRRGQVLSVEDLPEGSRVRARVSGADLPGVQEDLVRAIYETGTPTVVVDGETGWLVPPEDEHAEILDSAV